jgi:hypothetical protein
MERRKFRCGVLLLVVFCLLFPAVSQAWELSRFAGASRAEPSASSASPFAGTGSAFLEVWKSLLDLLGGVIGDDTPPPTEGDNRGGIDPNGVCGSNP